MLGLGAPGLLGAGGIGGLLGVEDGSTGADYLPTYNGRGDVCQLIDASNGALAARYEYDPFGKLTALGGAYADANPFRFSTKIADAATGYSYFGYRDYHPHLGRWLNRDPIAEAGGLNLYAYVGNAVADQVDWLGLCAKIGVGTRRLPQIIIDTIQDNYGDNAQVVPKGGPQAYPSQFVVHQYDSSNTYIGSHEFTLKGGDTSDAISQLSRLDRDLSSVNAAANAAEIALQVGTEIAAPVIGAMNATHDIIEGEFDAGTALEFVPLLGAVGDARKLGKLDDAAKPKPDGLRAAETASDDIRPNCPPCVTRADEARSTGKLRDRLGDPPGDMIAPQAHHDLPQADEFQEHWVRAGLDIEDPAYGRWVEGGPVGGHQRWSKAFNDEWRAFFLEYPRATRAEILSNMSRLRNDPRFQ